MDFRLTRRPGHAEAFARLALAQTPDALLICRADSRVAPKVFASLEPGDLLVVRSVGNLLPCYAGAQPDRAGACVAAAIELAIQSLHVRDVVVCGHSECAAMRLLSSGERSGASPRLAARLQHGAPALAGRSAPPPGLAAHDHLSQRSARRQLDHLRTYPIVRESEAAGRRPLHAWWFDIRRAEVLEHDAASDAFVPLDEARAAVRMARLR